MPFTPYDAGSDCIARARRMLRRVPQMHPGVRMDARRLSLVLAVAALDTYMHRLILERVYVHEELPGKLASLTLPFEYALELVGESADAARAEPHNSRPRVGLKRALRERLLRETYQRYDDVSTALGMAGLSGNWRAIGQQFSPTLTPEQIKKRLNGIVDRRNQIVHEGDYRRLERPQDSQRNGMTQTAALRDVTFIGDLIDAIHAVA